MRLTMYCFPNNVEVIGATFRVAMLICARQKRGIRTRLYSCWDLL